MLRERVFSGIKWQVGISISQKVLSFGTTIILARFLGPSMYGLFALALIVVSSFELFKCIGIDAALIRRQDDFEIAANTAFIIIPFLGIFLYFILNSSASFVGKFLNNQDIIPVLKILGLIFVISSFTRVPAVILERNIRFKEVSIAEFYSTVFFSVSALILVLLKFNVWALVFAYIIKTAVYMIMIWSYVRWKPKFQFDRKVALEMFNFGKFIFLASALLFVKMNLDNLLVGKLLGITMLGLYSIAFNIANFCSDYFGNKVNRVFYPAYSKLGNNPQSLSSAFMKTLKFTSIVAFLFGAGVLAIGPEFLKLLYGDKWDGATTVLKIMAFAGIFNTIPAGITALFLSLGKPRIGFYLMLIELSIFCIFIPPMANLLGINGVGIIISASSFLSFCVALIVAMRLLSLDIRKIYLTFKPALFSSIFMLGIILLIKRLMFFYSQTYITMKYNFIILFPLALVVYLVTLYKIDKSTLKDLKEIIFR